MEQRENDGRNVPRLDRVQRGEPITADAWNQIVDAINRPVDVSIKRTRRPPASTDIRPARLRGAWRKNEAGVWTAEANFLTESGFDNSFTFTVYGPTLSPVSPATTPRGGIGFKVFVIWRDRWEALQYNDQYIPQWGPDAGIEFASYVGYDRTFIKNTGLRGAIVQNPGGTSQSNYTDQNGNLQFDGVYLTWRDNYTDTFGKRNLTLRTKRVTVVTGMNGGTPTTETITVLDPTY